MSGDRRFWPGRTWRKGMHVHVCANEGLREYLGRVVFSFLFFSFFWGGGDWREASPHGKVLKIGYCGLGKTRLYVPNRGHAALRVWLRFAAGWHGVCGHQGVADQGSYNDDDGVACRANKPRHSVCFAVSTTHRQHMVVDEGGPSPNFVGNRLDARKSEVKGYSRGRGRREGGGAADRWPAWCRPRHLLVLQLLHKDKSHDANYANQQIIGSSRYDPYGVATSSVAWPAHQLHGCTQVARGHQRRWAHSVTHATRGNIVWNCDADIVMQQMQRANEENSSQGGNTH